MRLAGKRQTTKAAGKVFQRLDDDIESLYIVDIIAHYPRHIIMSSL